MDAQDWRHLTALFLARMEIDPDAMQWIAVRHHDAAHDHVHIVANRIRLDGSLWSCSQDVYRAIDATQEIELSRSEFEKACREAGIECRANIAKTGKMSGYSFSYQGHAFPGSKVGAGWKKLSGILGEREKSHSEVAHDLRNFIFSALETGNFHSEIIKKGWSINGNRIFSSCGQEINLEEWGISPQEIDEAAAKIKNAPAGERARSKGILPSDLESLAVLAVVAPSVLAALIALDILIRIGEASENAKREARREAWKKVHEISLYIEEKKEENHGGADEGAAKHRGEPENALDGRRGAIESGDRTDRDHGGEEQRDVPDMGGKSLRSLRENSASVRECSVPPVERSRRADAPLPHDIGSAENAGPEPRTGEEAHALDLDPDLRHLAAHLADLAAAPIAPPAPEDAPPEEPDPLPEEPEIDVEEPEVEEEEIEESESWTWGR
jgi:hypothetical protein